MDLYKILIKEGQGYRSNVYKSTSGYDTIGYGHKLIPEQIGNLNKLTNQQAQLFLERDLRKAQQTVRKQIGQQTLEKIGLVRKAVLVDMTFNVGSLTKFVKFREALKKGDYDQTANEILDSKYAKQVGAQAVRNSQIMKTGEIMTKEQALKLSKQEKKSHQTIKINKLQNDLNSNHQINQHAIILKFTDWL